MGVVDGAVAWLLIFDLMFQDSLLFGPLFFPLHC